MNIITLEEVKNTALLLATEMPAANNGECTYTTKDYRVLDKEWGMEESTGAVIGPNCLVGHIVWNLTPEIWDVLVAGDSDGVASQDISGAMIRAGYELDAIDWLENLQAIGDSPGGNKVQPNWGDLIVIAWDPNREEAA